MHPNPHTTIPESFALECLWVGMLELDYLLPPVLAERHFAPISADGF